MGGQNARLLQGQQPIQIDHPVFQSAKILEQNSVHYMTISMGIQEKEYAKWKEVLDKLKMSPQYLLLPKNHQFGGKGFCGSAGTVNISYDFHPYILMEEIQSRKKSKSRFQECELWFLLYVLAAAEQEMKQLFGTKIGDVRPHNIFLNEDGQIKISCLNSWPRQKSSFQKAYEHQNTFLAPEEMNKLELGGSDDLENYQSEMFSIGITILSAALLKDFSDIYDAKKMKFDYEKAEKYLHQWKHNNFYSEILIAVVCNLCSFSPQRRLTEKDLWIWIREYELSIKNKENFIIKKAPLKIQAEVQSLRGSSRSSRIDSVFSNRISRNVESFYRHPIVMYSEGLNAQRVVSPSAIIQHRMVSPNNTSGGRNVVMVSSRQSVPYSFVQNTESVHQKNLVDQSIDIQAFQSRLQVKTSGLKPNLVSNGVSAIHKQHQSQQVQAFFSPLQSMVSQNDFNSAKGGYFVYTRRIVNPTTNSLLAQESINEEQYHKGIIQKNLEAIQEKNSVTAQSNNESLVVPE